MSELVRSEEEDSEPVARFHMWKYRLLALRNMRESEEDGWNAVVVRGVRFM